MNLKFNTDSKYFLTYNEGISKLSKFKRSKSLNSENLKVDSITFNLKDIQNVKKREICEYLLRLGFNCFDFNIYFQAFCVKSKNNYRVNLVKYAWFQKGIQLRFSGENAEYLYSLIKKRIINWKFFDGGNLARFDLCFDRTVESSDKVEPITFLHKCSELIQKKYKKKHRCILRFGSILTINNP